jgi:PAS domain S-box-containing protein
VARDEGWRRRKDGTKFWARVVITAVHNEKGNVIGFTKVTRDLTTIKEAQDAQMVSADMYELIVEQTNRLAHIGGWELDLVNNALSWTSATKQIHGVDEDYVPHLDEAINFYKGSSRAKIEQAVNRAIGEGIPWDLELQITTKQGQEVWIHTIGKSNHRDGVCSIIYGTFQDINAGRQAALNLLQDKLICEELLNAASDISIIATDANGIIKVFNSGAEKLLGYTTDEVISKHNPCLFHFEDELMQRGQQLTTELGSAAEGFNVLVHKAHTMPASPDLWTYVRKDGIKKEVSLIATPIRENETTVKGYLFIGTALP